MSLKIIHTADWHLGQTFFGYDREAEHTAFLSWLVEILAEQQADVLLIAGDIFDVANPSASSQRHFFQFLKEANRKNPQLQIIIIAGNHDSAARMEAPIPVLEELNTHIIGTVQRKEDGSIDFDSLLIPLYNREGEQKGLCMAVPFLRQGDYPPASVNTYMDGVGRMYQQLYTYALEKRQAAEAIIAMGHLHVTGAEISDNDRSERTIMGGLESIAAEIFDKGIAYTALGHIHKAQRVGGIDNIRYAGSPLPMSFSETRYNHQVVSVTIHSGNDVSIETISIPKTVELLRIPLQPAIAEEVLAQLEKLPDAEDSDSSFYPFLEIRVLMTEPDPAFRHKVEEVIQGKAVRLAHISPSYPEKTDDNSVRLLSYVDLQKIDPLDMLRHAFTTRYGGDELPEEIEELFKEVLQEVSL